MTESLFCPSLEEIWEHKKLLAGKHNQLTRRDFFEITASGYYDYGESGQGYVVDDRSSTDKVTKLILGRTPDDEVVLKMNEREFFNSRVIFYMQLKDRGFKEDCLNNIPEYLIAFHHYSQDYPYLSKENVPINYRPAYLLHILKSLEGKQVTLGRLTAYLDKVCKLIPDSEGWFFSSCNESHEQKEVILSYDKSKGLTDKKRKGKSLFEVRFTECEPGEHNPKDIITIDKVKFSF